MTEVPDIRQRKADRAHMVSEIMRNLHASAGVEGVGDPKRFAAVLCDIAQDLAGNHRQGGGEEFIAYRVVVRRPIHKFTEHPAEQACMLSAVAAEISSYISGRFTDDWEGMERGSSPLG